MRLQASLNHELTTANPRTKIKQNIEFTTPLGNFFRYFCKLTNSEEFTTQFFIAHQILFVIGLDMSVAGVALATVIAQAVSVTLLLRCMCKMEGSCRLDLKKLGIKKEKAWLLLRHGLPAGLQGSVFSFSNVLSILVSFELSSKLFIMTV